MRQVSKLQSILAAPIALLALLVATSAWAGATPNVLVAGSDFDGDGAADLFSTGSSATRVDLINPATGTTRKQTGIAVFGVGYVATAGGAWTLAAVGDCDGDGFADLVYTNAGTVKVVFMEGQSQVSDDSVTFIAAGGWTLAAIGDVTGDGAADLVFNSANFIRVTHNISQAGTSSNVYTSNAAGTYTAALVADVDGAGGNVGVVANGSGSNIRITQFNGAAVSGNLYVGNGAGTFTAAFAGQADGVNGQDLFLRSGSATKIVLVDGTGQIGQSFQADGPFPLDLVADVNADGKVDLIGSDTSSVTFRVELVDGSPTGTRGYIAMPSATAVLAAAGDTNQDDQVDMQYNNAAGGTFDIILMNGVSSSGSGTLSDGGGEFSLTNAPAVPQY